MGNWNWKGEIIKEYRIRKGVEKDENRIVRKKRNVDFRTEK